MLGSGHAFIHQPFIVASPFFILIFAGSRGHFVASRARHRIPAFGFGRGFKRGLFRIHVRFARQFPLGLFPIGFRHLLAERSSMAASSTARSRTILRVTVPMPAEFSVKTPSFSGFGFIGQKLPRVKCLVVMRCFHFASPALLTQVAGFGKNVVALFGFRIWHDFVVIRSQLVQSLWKNGSLQVCLRGW